MSPHHHQFAETLERRTHALRASAEQQNDAKIDRFFAGLFLAQWASLIGIAWLMRADVDDLFTAIVIGAAIAVVPTGLVVWKPGTMATRHAIAVGQMIYGALLMDLTRGAYDAHLHIFVSLSMLALYRDVKILLTASAVVVLHLVAMTSVSVVMMADRALWIAVANTVLFVACRRGARDLTEVATNDARLEAIQADFLASMSKEFRTPMTAILGSADLLLDPDRKSLDPRSHIKRIQRNGHQLLSLLDEMSDATSLQPRPTSVLEAAPRKLECSVPLADDAVVTHALGSAVTLPPPALDSEPIYSDHSDMVDMRELLDGFVIRLRQNAEQAEAAHAAGDRTELQYIAHQLRGAAGSFGFMPISEAAGALEDASSTNRPVEETLVALVKLCRRARTHSFAQAA